MPTIVIPDIKDESRTVLVRHENTVTTEKDQEFFVETGEGLLLEGPFDTAKQALVRSKARSVEFKVKDIGKLKNVIRLNEGVRHNVYLDKRKNLTVGVGFNLNRSDLVDKFDQAGIDVTELIIDKISLTHTQIDMLFDLTLTDVLKEIREVVKDFDNLSISRQIALADTMFQLGKTKFLKFKRMIGHVNNKNWVKAAEQLLDSEMALVTSPDRARRNAERMIGASLKHKIASPEPFFSPTDPKTDTSILPSFSPEISGLFVPKEIFKIPSPKLQQKFNEDLLQRLDGLPLGDLGRIALNQELITEAGLTIISRKDLIKIIFNNLVLVARTKGI